VQQPTTSTMDDMNEMLPLDDVRVPS
jgi:hypothetical protein